MEYDFCCDCICLSCKYREYAISGSYCECNRCDFDCETSKDTCEEYEYSDF